MKLQDSNLPALSFSTGHTQASDPVGHESGVRPTPRSRQSGDRVELSNFSGKVAGVLSSAAQTRAGRVESLARAFAAGLHTVDARQTSRALIDETLSTTAGEKAGSGGK